MVQWNEYKSEIHDHHGNKPLHVYIGNDNNVQFYVANSRAEFSVNETLDLCRQLIKILEDEI